MSTQFILISNPTTIFYKTGFGDPQSRERDSWMLQTPHKTYFFTDGRYESKALVAALAKKSIEFKLISAEKRLTQHLLELTNDRELMYEKNDLTVAEYEQFIKKGVKLTDAFESSNIRAIKNTNEITYIKKACTLVDSLLKKVIPGIKIGISEKEILALLNYQLVEHIKQTGTFMEFAFTPIVAIDENSAVAHYDTKAQGKKRVKKGSLTLIDCGIRYKNYCSDITRMVSAGKPRAEIQSAYDALFRAQQQAISALSSFDSYQKVDKLCRNSIDASGFPSYSHATGHGIGVQVHENPSFSPLSTDTIKPGHVVTVEPGIYIPGKWGMRLEDTVFITANRSVTVLTKTNKTLHII